MSPIRTPQRASSVLDCPLRVDPLERPQAPFRVLSRVTHRHPLLRLDHSVRSAHNGVDPTCATLATRGLNIPAHDYISFSPAAAPTDGDQTVTYKQGGAGGTTVATLTLTYAGGELSAVARS